MFLGMLLLAAAEASARPPQPEQVQGEEIIVTGERAKRSLKDTPSSVVVFDKHDIDRMAAPDRMQQVLQLVPNVLITNSRDVPVIRGQLSSGVLAGLPAFLGGARPRTVLQIDGRTITFNEFANGSQGLWDVEHVEVFRSPQTTTQGVNSIAGAIFIQTADPTYEVEGRARLVLGNQQRRQLSAVVSAPLIDDQLAIRVAGDLYRGHSANRLEGPVDGVDLNDDHYGVARVKLLAEPHAIPGLKVLLTYAHNHSESPQGEPARPPFSDRRDDFCVCGYFRVNVDSLTGAITYRITDSLESRTTLSWGDTFYRRFALKGFGQTHIHGTDGSVESLLDWKPAGPVGIIGGVSWQAMDLNQFIDLTLTPLGTGKFKDRQRSFGLFGEVTWHPAPRVLLTGGMRYQRDSKRRLGVLHTVPDQPLDYDKSVDAFLPKVSAAYDLSSDVRVGLMVQRAYNPGGVTLDPDRSAVVRFNPEYLWDYEAFTRASFLGGTLNVIGNLFYNDMKDAQRTLDLCLQSPAGCVGLSEVSNAPRAHSYGAEIELDYKPSDRLTLRSGIGLLRTQITKTILPADPILDKQFAFSPKFTGMAVLDWRPVRRLLVSAQVRHYSSYFNDDSETLDTRVQATTTVDARVSWQTKRFTLFAYAQNLLDKFRITGWSTPPNDPDVEVGTNDPREIGVGIEARF